MALAQYYAFLEVGLECEIWGQHKFRDLDQKRPRPRKPPKTPKTPHDFAPLERTRRLNNGQMSGAKIAIAPKVSTFF